MYLGLQLHIPFCGSRYSCCGQFKEPCEPAPEKRFYEALRIETQLVAQQYRKINAEISTIYVRGGTPSLTSLDLFADWLGQLRSLFHVPDGIEFSLELDPECVDLELLAKLMELGVNRPVFGIRSFDRNLLQLLGCKHQPDDSHRTVYLANALGCDSFGIDFLFGLPGQGGKMLSADLDHLLDLDPPHISFRQFTVDNGTALQKRVDSGAISMPDDVLTMALYRGGAARLVEAGYVRYEISSFAKEGCECRHSLSHWGGNDHLALGPSGHSFILGQYLANTRSVIEYIESLMRRKRPLVVDEPAREQRMTEAIYDGLRTARGIDRRRFAERFGQPLEDRLDRNQYDMFIRSGHLIPDRGNLRLSDEGILLADEITRRLVK